MARKKIEVETSSVEYLIIHFCKTKEFADGIISGMIKDLHCTRYDALEYFRSFGLYYSKLPKK